MVRGQFSGRKFSSGALVRGTNVQGPIIQEAIIQGQLFEGARTSPHERKLLKRGGDIIYKFKLSRWKNLKVFFLVCLFVIIFCY